MPIRGSVCGGEGGEAMTQQAHLMRDPYRWGRIVAARVMRDELGQTNPVDIEDAESVAHYAVAYAMGRWDPRRGEVSTLIAMTVRQRVLQWWERDYKKRRPWVSLTMFSFDGEEPQRDELRDVPDFDRHFIADHIRACLRRLPTRDRQLLIAHYLNGRTTEHLAQEMKVHRHTVNAKIKQARERFEAMMRGQEL